MSESNPDNADPGLRIKQIDAEMVEIEQEMKRVEGHDDEAGSRDRAELTERLQQLKSEKNMLVKQQNASDD